MLARFIALALFLLIPLSASGEVCKTYAGCSGGGGTITAEFAALGAIDGTAFPLVMVTNCNDASCTDGGGTTRVLKYWNGAAWVNQASAGSAADLGVSTTATGLTVTNTVGADAVLPAATTSAAGVATAIDRTRLDSVYTVRDVGGAAGIDQTDLVAALNAACDVSGGEMLAECRPVLLAEDATLSATWFVSSDGLGPSAPGVTTGEAAWTVEVIGLGPALTQTPKPPAATAARCGTTIYWEGPANQPMIWVHAGRNVVFRNLCIDAVGASGAASHALLFTAGNAVTDPGEISAGVRVENVDIYGFESSWAGILAQVPTVGIALAPDNFGGGDPPYAADVQIDNFVVRDSRIIAPRPFLGANGFTNGVRIENSTLSYGEYGAWAEDSDLTIEGGYITAWARAGQTGDEATACNNTIAALLIGSTSSEQPRSVQWNEPYPEIDCGLAIDTVAATDPADTRDSNLTISGGAIVVGGNAQTAGIRYNHLGSISILGTIIGSRNGEDFSDDFYVTLNPPDKGDGSILRALIDSPTIGDWDSGVFRVSTNARVKPGIAADNIDPEEVDVRNVALDRDGDGDPDYYHFHANATSDAQDVYDALQLLTDTSAKVFRLTGVVDSSAMTSSAQLTWDATTLVPIPANTTFECEPGARIYGPSLAFWKNRSTTTRHVGNVVGDDNVVVRGCYIENTDLLEAFDGDTAGVDWTTSLFGGIHFGSCENCLAEGNVVRGSPHAGFFATRSSGTTFRGNYAYATGEAFNNRGDGVTTLAATEPAGETVLDLTATLANCAVNDWILVELDEPDPQRKPGTSRNLWAAGWVETAGDPITIRRAAYGSGRNPGLPSQASAGNAVFCSEGDKQAFEFYTEDDAVDASGVDYVATGNVMEFNRAELIPGIAFQIRGVNLNEDECEDGSQVTCWHEGTVIRGNVAHDVGSNLLQVRGARNSLFEGNLGERTGGVLFVPAAQGCSEPYDDSLPTTGDQRECSINSTFRGNIIRDCAPNDGGAALGGCVRVDPGHERISWLDSNSIDGNIGGHGYMIGGNARDSVFQLRARNIEDRCLIDGLAVSDAITEPLTVDAVFNDCGIGSLTVESRAVHLGGHNTALNFGKLSIAGITGSALRVDPAGGNATFPTIAEVDIDATLSGYSGTFATEALANAAVECNPGNRNLWLITQNASSASDCTLTAGTGVTENACYCNGATWIDLTPPAGQDVIMPLAGSGETISGGGILSGRIRNTASPSRWLFASYGSGSVSGLTLQNLSLERGPGVLTANTVNGLREATESLSGLTVRNLTFGTELASRYTGIEAADYSADARIVDTAAPSGACTGGTLYVDSDAAAGAVLHVCENGSWTALGAGGGGSVATDAIWDAAGDLAVGTGANTATRLPIGTNGQFLGVSGGAVAWGTPAGAGDVSKVGTPANDQVGVWTGDGTIEGTSALTFNSTTGILSINVANGGVDATPAAATGSVYTFKEGSNNGSNVITVTAPAAVAADRACTLSDSATPFDGCVAADVVLVASGIESLATNAIASGACDTTDTGVTATGVTGNDVLSWTPVGDISGVTGYAPVTTGALIIYPYTTTNAVNFKVCNPTSSSITPGAVSLNWKVFR